MHGIIHLELQNFVVQHHGEAAWRALTDAAGLSNEIYTPLRSYPDEQLVALVGAAVPLTGTDATTLLEAFGEFLVPRYLALYGKLLKPEWRTLDVLEHAENTIHRVVRLREPGALPPRLQAQRVNPNAIRMSYDSPRKLCAVARGIARGVAGHFNEDLFVSDEQCMHRGDRECVMLFSLAAAAPV
jgi:heme-NO-binding protein